MDKITRQEAKKAGLARYFTGKPCKHGHIAERRVDNGACSVCSAEQSKKWHAEHRECMRKINQRNLEKKRIWQKNDYAQNPERYRAYAKKYRDNNKEKRCAYESLRKNRKRNATPDWLTAEDKQWMDAIYRESKALKDKYGVDCTVDHIVPIKGKNVCGLHVPWNLRLMERSANSSKRITVELDNTYSVTTGNILAHESVLPWNLRIKND